MTAMDVRGSLMVAVHACNDRAKKAGELLHYAKRHILGVVMIACP